MGDAGGGCYLSRRGKKKKKYSSRWRGEFSEGVVFLKTISKKRKTPIHERKTQTASKNAVHAVRVQKTEERRGWGKSVYRKKRGMKTVLSASPRTNRIKRFGKKGTRGKAPLPWAANRPDRRVEKEGRTSISEGLPAMHSRRSKKNHGPGAQPSGLGERKY